MEKIPKLATVSTKTKMMGECENAKPPENIEDAISFTEYLRNRWKYARNTARFAVNTWRPFASARGSRAELVCRAESRPVMFPRLPFRGNFATNSLRKLRDWQLEP